MTQITDVKVKKGTLKSVTPVYTNNEKILVEKGEGDISYKYEITDEIDAPVKKGSRLGKIIVYTGENVIGEIYLTSDKDIDTTTFQFIFKKLLTNI